MLFHFFLYFYFIFFVIASYNLISSTKDANCENNCTGTYNENYICLSAICEDLSNPRENVTAAAPSTLSNIPCRFANSVNTGCPPP